MNFSANRRVFRPRWRSRLPWALAAWLLAAPASAGVQDERQVDPSELRSLSIEELMEVEVTSVSRRIERFSQTSASLTVITNEDIRRSGVRSLPEALRLANSLHVARVDSRTWAISARGFNISTANKMLVMIDGRTVYDPFFSGVFWDVQDTMLEDIDRIEIIRGPGGSLWGANAVNGVINIITKPATETQGGLVVLGSGNHERGIGAVRYGGKLGRRTSYRVFTKYKNESSERPISPSEYDLSLTRAGFRMDTELSSADAVKVTGEAYGGVDKSVWQEPVLQPPSLADWQDRAAVAGGFMTGEWDHVYSNGSDSILRTYYEYHSRSAGNLDLHRHAVNAEFQHNFRLGERQRVSWGGGARYLADSTAPQGHGLMFSPPSSDDGIGNLFIEDAVSTWGGRLVVTFGSKLQYDGYSGTEVLPTLRAIWMPDRRHAAWAAVSRAARTPARLERDLVTDVFAFPTPSLPLVVQFRGSKSMRAEHVVAYETGYRWQPGRTFSLDAAAYYNRYSDLSGNRDAAVEFAARPVPHFVQPILVENAFDGPSYGGEVQAKLQPWERWRVSTGYAFFRASTHPQSNKTGARPQIADGTSPRHTLLVESSCRLFQNVESGAFLRAMSSAPDANTPKYAELDLNLRVKLGESAVVSINADDLFSRDKPEFALVSGNQPAPRGRSIYAKVTWRF